MTSPAAEALGDGRAALRTLVAWTPWVGAAAGGSVLAAGPALREPVTVGVAPLVGAAAAVAFLGARLALGARATAVFGLAGGVALAPVGWVAVRGAPPATVAWLCGALVGAVALGLWGWRAVARHGGSEPASRLAGFVVFGHAFDALTTAVGVEVLGFGEQTPLSRTLLEVATAAPGGGVLGTAWLFIAVKLVVAVGVVVVFVDYGHSPAVDLPVVALAGFVGLWPAVHNAVLFATA